VTFDSSDERHSGEFLPTHNRLVDIIGITVLRAAHETLFFSYPLVVPPGNG
jgi:hypothetical protein